MVNTRFEAYKVKRELKRSGINYTFKRCELNKFKEPVGEEVVVGQLRGIYHELSGSVAGYVRISTGDTTQIRSKKEPMILCLYEDAASLKLRAGDVVKIGSKKLKVTGIVNIQEWNIIADISLEVFDNVVQT